MWNIYINAYVWGGCLFFNREILALLFTGEAVTKD